MSYDHRMVEKCMRQNVKQVDLIPVIDIEL